ncbi:WG repeat-containing protein [Sinomicrobium weinanense]|uniref:WG repeat-containing protein n=1 Tax=Sinomicrobium weinanense TaxID=2842200 RepID=A0A926JQ43_9FLAO|nr:WG repeat-containing protein [Sinomicrobium weinanense]MBC9795237.1 WG repeat-containing protein [Sinomicrobium weinanense]MBU3122014.1 WG repeat-containing protein [Sinomicrobium weinanense]
MKHLFMSNRFLKITIPNPITIFLLWIAVIPAQAQELFSTYGNCAQSTYGYIHIKDSTQNIVPIYCNAGNFFNGLASVKKNGKWGFIDAHNKEAIAFQYDYARDFKSGQAIVQQGEFYGVVNPQGEFVIPPNYYDLKPYELVGKRYYISRDSTFFAGIIDENGKEILPHQYTYVMEFEGFVSMGSPRLYKNIPFYTMYREVDTSQGSFYEQFKANPYHFSPDKGHQEIYDNNFNQLASRKITSYREEFNTDELTSIDNYLEDHQGTDVHQKRVAIRQLLESQEEYKPKTGNAAPKNFPSTEEELNQYMAQMGYEKFSDENGKTGIKKHGKIILPAEFNLVKWWGAVLPDLSKEHILYLKEQYAGKYSSEENDLFELFCILAGNQEKGAVYTMKGEKVFELGKNSFIDTNPIGFVCQTTERDTLQQLTQYKTRLINWKGQPILPTDNYPIVKVLNKRYLLTKRIKEAEQGTEELIGLYNASGKTIIPEGTFAFIEPFPEIPDFYLAEKPTLSPTIPGEQKDSAHKNKHFAIIKVEGDTYSITNEFNASMVYPLFLGTENDMLKYRIEKED